MFEGFLQIDWVRFAELSSPMIIVLCLAVMLLFYSAFGGDGESVFSGYFTVVGLFIAAAVAWSVWTPDAGVNQPFIMMDRVTIVGWLICIASAILTVGMALPYHRGRRVLGRDFHALVLLAVFGMGVLVAAHDLITLLLGLEIMSIAAYSLTGIFRWHEASVEGALKYFLMGAFATAFFCMGIAFMLGSLGSIDLSVIAERAPEVVLHDGKVFFLFGVALLVIGFGFKVAAVPFHAWAPDAYEGAPTPVANFMATGIKAAAFIALYRVAVCVGGSGIVWHHVIWAISFSTMLFANLAAIRQTNLKRLLAYSSIAHAGYILVAFASISAESEAVLGALVVYLVAYVVMTAGAFAAVAALDLSPGESVDIAGLVGLGRRRPVFAAVLSLFMLSLAGFPPTLGFFGKYYLFLAAVKNGDVMLVVVAVLASVVSVYYYLRPVVAMYFRETAKERVLVIAPAVVAILALMAMAVVTFGVFPQDLVAFVSG